jgi:hypothetical protein
MRGDARLGALVRELRTARSLTLAGVARRIGCAESLLSQAETGARVLQPWLAEAMDAVYGTGGTVTALCATAAFSGPGKVTNDNAHNSGVPDLDVIFVRIPRRTVTVPVSRYELLAALSIGAVSGTLLSGLQQAVASVRPDEELLAELEQTLRGLQKAGRIMPPGRLVGPLTGQVGLIDAVRRRAPCQVRRNFTILQARYAESLSWMAEEADNPSLAAYWTDRAQHWARAAGWWPMIAYAHVRRSMLAISFADDGLAAVEQALTGLNTPSTPTRIRGLATKQLAYGYALAHRPDASRRALEQTVRLFDASCDGCEDGPIVGQHSVADPDLLAIYQATCDVYLGRGDSVIAELAPRMVGIGDGSKRTHAITAAKLAQAYAHAGEPGLACGLILDTLDAATAVDSLTTRSELGRAVPVLGRWPRRDDVNEVRHRLAVLGRTRA